MKAVPDSFDPNTFWEDLAWLRETYDEMRERSQDDRVFDEAEILDAMQTAIFLMKRSPEYAVDERLESMIAGLQHLLDALPK